METALYIMWVLLIITAVLFLISGLDDVIFDVSYWCRYIYRKFKTRKYKPVTYEDLITVPQQKIAIIVPCWHEYAVIGEMLRFNVSAIDYSEYDIFVGLYPNDLKTIAAVKEAHELYPHIQYMVGSEPGPSTKAANLNKLYQYILEYEQKNKVHYDIFVMHDSEDVIHPVSLRFYNYLIPRKDMIQLPVFPLEVPWWQFTHWVYNDEFAENHTKDIIVREAIRGLVPSAGVSTAFSRKTIDLLAEKNGGVPFSVHSFTEDYDTALRINLEGLKSIFVFQKIKIFKKYYNIFDKPRYKIIEEPVAARALFPTQYLKSVRQKARWVMGIAMQEWSHVGWPGSFFTKYTLFHDRKTVVTHYVNILGYLVFFFWLFYFFWQRYHPQYPTLQEFFNMNPWVWYIIVACTLIMIERLIQRAIAVYRVYGLLPALLSAPRAVYGNFVNMHALLLAYWQYFVTQTRRGKVKWAKTEHTFPSNFQLKKLRSKLGNLLISQNIISQEQLDDALIEQRRTGTLLGDVLVSRNYLTKSELIAFLAQQEDMEFIRLTNNQVLTRDKLRDLSRRHYNWLIKHGVLPISLENNTLTLAILDPADHQLQVLIRKRVAPYDVRFVAYTR